MAEREGEELTNRNPELSSKNIFLKYCYNLLFFIIFLSKKHYKGSFESITEDKKLVGSRYIIDNYATNTEKEKFDSDEDNAEIEINGKKYKQMHHKKDFGYSNLRQIKI